MQLFHVRCAIKKVAQCSYFMFVVQSNTSAQIVFYKYINTQIINMEAQSDKKDMDSRFTYRHTMDWALKPPHSSRCVRQLFSKRNGLSV
jgi:hypothetical protein